jgi:hypothetical protein
MTEMIDREGHLPAFSGHPLIRETKHAGIVQQNIYVIYLFLDTTSELLNRGRRGQIQSESDHTFCGLNNFCILLFIPATENHFPALPC